MRIWIVASDPFYREFEKIAEKWTSNNEITITLISKYGYNIKSLIKFCSIYLKEKPETILTDHGYFGFFFVLMMSKILGISTKFNFYLRGNYWLEERQRNEKAN